MTIAWLLERMNAWRESPAIVWGDRPVTYGYLLDEVSLWKDSLSNHGIKPGSVVALEGDYSPRAVSLLLALIDSEMMAVPLTRDVEAHRSEFMETAEVQVVITFDGSDQWQIEHRDVVVHNPVTLQLIEQGQPGLVLFSSGSTGKSKATMHNFTALLKRFRLKGRRMNTLAFLLLDHIGGINTLFYTISSGGTVVSVQNRDPEVVCDAIERHKIGLLPTSPTFLNLLLLSASYRHHDLSSLKRITYGTEPMPESTLHKIHEIFPDVVLQQTYGLSELGILASKSRDSSSLWVKMGGGGFKTKVVDGVLWIHSESAMVGYLNAANPFDEEGWFNTGDLVEMDGEYIRFLGRDAEIINVGGQKVHPAEVESIIMQMDNFRDVTVYGEKNPITGTIVAARVNLTEPEDLTVLKRRIRYFCKDKLAPYKIPVRIDVTQEEQFSARYKKMR